MTASTRTPTVLAAILRDIQSPVQGELDAVREEMWRIVASDLPLANEVQQHLMGMQGKMFRPTLTLLGSAIEGRRDPRAITYAAILELIHLATLVHDDAVDHSVLRRGMPTVNAVFSHQMSIIMGDYLYTRALRELVDLGDLDIMRAVSAASNEMTIGEIRQLSSYDALAYSEDDYEQLIYSKTASLFGTACEVGALCGAPAHRAALARFGERLGMAFQVADDLLDYTEAAAITGKPSGLDLREHKVTLPLISALRTMSPADRARVDALFAEPSPDAALVAEVAEIVRANGGLEYARRRGEQYAREAEAALQELPRGEAHSALADALGYVIDRRW